MLERQNSEPVESFQKELITKERHRVSYYKFYISEINILLLVIGLNLFRSSAIGPERAATTETIMYHD